VLLPYALVGLVGLLIGFFVGQLSTCRQIGGSTLDQAAPPVPHPRTLSP